MFEEIKENLKKNKMKPKIKQANMWFDIVAFLILCSHLFMSFYGVYYRILPDPLLVVFFVLSRTSLAGVGHYHCHRKSDGIDDWGDCLFDIQYVGASIILSDGHVLLHHMYTNTHADVKRTVFTGMLDLPRILRVPIYTIVKFF